MSLRTRIAGALLVLVLTLFAVLGVGRVVSKSAVEPVAVEMPGPDSALVASEDYRGFLYGRVTTDLGVTYEGRLRWGGDEEAFWGDYFNGIKSENAWVEHVPEEQLPKESRSFKIFGLELARQDNRVDLRRPFVARFGDIQRIDAGVQEVRVTLKSGAVVVLDRLATGDIDDGVRVWDADRGVVDVETRRIRSVEFRSAPQPYAVPERLYGTVRTRRGELTGFVQWNRDSSVGSDELDGRAAEGNLAVRFATIRSIAKQSVDSSLVTLRDGREIVLSGTRDVGGDHRGTYVDGRYGRVLVSWDAFERVDFNPVGSGPAYDDFLPGRPLRGSVRTRAGRQLAGRLVYDLDESETTETLDAPFQGLDYAIPFERIARIESMGLDEPVRVTLHGGEELKLERAGDLGGSNAGLLVFVDVLQQPDYLRWADIERIDLDRPADRPADLNPGEE